MKFLIDKSPAVMAQKSQSDIVMGQLLTPLTRYADWGGTYAIDNGAFSGLDSQGFRSLLARQWPARERCLFVTCPDIPGNARRTIDLWERRALWIDGEWPLALVAQNGAEDLPIPWDELAAIFIGGLDPWKDSRAAADIVKTAKALGKWVHVGRVNTAKRFDHFAELGADTCDGSGVAMYDHMLEAIEHRRCEPSLFDN